MNDYSNIEDNDLMTLYKGGDHKAFECLHFRRKGQLFRHLIYGMGLREAVAEEIAQDTWFAIISTRDRYEPTAQFMTWALTIARRKAMDFQGKKSTRSEFQAMDDDGPESVEMADARTPEMRQSQKDLKRALDKCRKTLTTGQREVLSLKEDCEMTITDVALIVAADRTSVAERAKRAYDNMRKCLTKSLGKSVVAAFLIGEGAHDEQPVTSGTEGNHDD